MSRRDMVGAVEIGDTASGLDMMVGTPVERELTAYEIARELERLTRPVTAKIGRASPDAQQALYDAYRHLGEAKWAMDRVDRAEATR